MTEEQIKQNAEDYINENTQGVIIDTNTRNFLLDVYLAGAHSRDEEIERLNKKCNFAIERLRKAYKEIASFRNPWISVKDRLPKYCTVPSTEQYIKNRRYWDSKVSPVYLVICSDPQGDYYQFANFLMFPEDKKPSWVFAEDTIKRNCVTHWMYIPELKKGE